MKITRKTLRAVIHKREFTTTQFRMSATIESQPAVDQLIEHNGKSYSTVKEGLAYILVPPNARTEQDPKSKKKDDGEQQAQSVFYNPIQQFNRDLSVLAIKAFGEHMCAIRMQAHEKKVEQSAKKRERKRQAEDHEAEEKRRKGNDGAAVVPVEQNGVDTEATTTAAAPEASVEVQGSTEAVGDQMDVDLPAAAKEHKFKPKFRVLDALSASGLRALRYAQEIPFATTVVANDMSPAAVEAIRLNVQHNKLTDKITPSTGNAIGHMYNAAYYTPSPEDSPSAHTQLKYDVIDLDPYGTAAPFLDAAVQALNDGGLLCVTCTDAGVFASCGYVEKTYSLYGGTPLKGPHSHEAGLRLILNSIAKAAAVQGIAIEPLLSLSIDFYARVWVRVRKSPADVKFLAGKTMLVHQCDTGCGSFQIQPLARHTAQKNYTNYKHTASLSTGESRCPHCGFKTHVAGPMWAGPLHNPYFIRRILDMLPDLDKSTYGTTTRIEGMLTSALDELDTLENSLQTFKGETEAPFIPSIPGHVTDPHPFFFIPSYLCKVLHCQSPSEAAIKGALRHAGFIATRSHTKPGTIKTNASYEAIWEIIREWSRQKAPVKEGKVGETQAGYKILQKMRKVDEAEEKKDGEDNGEKSEDEPATQPPADIFKFKIKFDERLGKDQHSKKLMRYQTNPRANWGPMSRAKGAS
ncbi:N2,N2-dimethylguanosine tRNA methyltransferase [Aureobasidium pullulans]|uniref:tRNA (guanine(26)-N(2))-dimethyltransferase n=1 Tax=Aureobasidium pullulans TaxID=5580 RepID=A0A4S9A2I7_AURPU|nr:N2,N2-dimethylguanosine tRNA methyltransferase [Aureobasidium pullulans]